MGPTKLASVVDELIFVQILLRDGERTDFFCADQAFLC